MKIAKKIDLQALNASFGKQTMFTLLSHQDDRRGLKMLNKIYDELKMTEFQEAPDIYGQPQPDPRERRLCR